jgi:hypothetical protein
LTENGFEDKIINRLDYLYEQKVEALDATAGSSDVIVFDE